MGLINLPAEIVRNILYALDPDSFYICLQTSKLFREHALLSADLLHHHISRIPGRKLARGTVPSDPAALLRVFGTRAAQHLEHGAPWMADVHLWRPGEDLDTRNSSLVWFRSMLFMPRARPDPPKKGWGRPAFLEIHKTDATVRVYMIEREVLGRNYRPRLRHVIAPNIVYGYFPTIDGHLYQLEVVKAVPFTPDEDQTGFGFNLFVAVLYRLKAQQCNCDTVYTKVVIFELDNNFGPVIRRTIELRSRERVVAMAVSGTSEPVVVYRSDSPKLFGYTGYRLAKYSNHYDEMGTEHSSGETTLMYSNSAEPVGGISICGRGAIHLYPTSFPIPHWGTQPHSSQASLFRRDVLLPDIVEIFVKDSLGHAIAARHHHYISEDDPDGARTCVNTALEFMIAREDSYQPSRSGAYLLKAIQYPDECKKFDLNLDYRMLEHIYVAQLAGLPSLDNLSTLGLIVAVSEAAHRIAIASWKTVKVWSLDPKAFLDPEYDVRDVHNDLIPGDHAYTEGCGWQFYASGRFERECVLLEPVELPSCGVVFGLEFRSEDELWGWCERGLVKWSFGAHATGKRVVEELPQSES